MIVMSFVYKQTVVQSESFDMELNEANKEILRDKLQSGEVAKPENYDLVIYSETELPLWVA